ncbi:MAG: hypothetical protein AB7U62_01365, partial [Pseudolabrys sp.]
HLHGLFRAVPGARAFRRHLATEAVKPGADAGVLVAALAHVPDDALHGSSPDLALDREAGLSQTAAA